MTFRLFGAQENLSKVEINLVRFVDQIFDSTEQNHSLKTIFHAISKPIYLKLEKVIFSLNEYSPLSLILSLKFKVNSRNTK